ncbi:MAG: prepilin-type N-terminal cleavage/methylation domain-containing protein [Deltaproteobacteria bacterium]
MRDAKGFTLVELLIAVGVAMGLLVAVYMAVNSTQHHSTAIERKVTAQQDLKPVLDIMAMEIGMVSYNPTAATNLWVNPTGSCLGTASNQIYRGIQEATANSIVVEMDIGPGGDGDGMLGDSNEVIRYNYDTTNQYITRETNCGGGQPFLGDTAASGRPRTVRVINNTLGIPVFRYYNGTGTEIASTGLPAGIPNIRRIDITLAVETEDVNANTGQRISLTYSTSVIPRNHAIQ